MKIAARYSHLNGEEYLIVHQPQLWIEVQNVIEGVDAARCRTKISRDKTKLGRTLYSPTDLNFAFKWEFEQREWVQQRRRFWVAFDERLMRRVYNLDPGVQKLAIEEAGYTPSRIL